MDVQSLLNNLDVDAVIVSNTGEWAHAGSTDVSVHTDPRQWLEMSAIVGDLPKGAVVAKRGADGRLHVTRRIRPPVKTSTAADVGASEAKSRSECDWPDTYKITTGVVGAVAGVALVVMIALCIARHK